MNVIKFLSEDTIKFEGFEEIKNNECWLALDYVYNNLLIDTGNTLHTIVAHVRLNPDRTVKDRAIHNICKNFGSLNHHYIYDTQTGIYIGCYPRFWDEAWDDE